MKRFLVVMLFVAAASACAPLVKHPVRNGKDGKVVDTAVGFDDVAPAPLK